MLDRLERVTGVVGEGLGNVLLARRQDVEGESPTGADCGVKIATALAVMPALRPFSSKVVATVTPVAKHPKRERNIAASARSPGSEVMSETMSM
jgi:hypothetical protein